jgi:hypothetical protein
MTPKEKAKELFDKYEKMYPLNFTKAGENFHKSNIIKCALIAVDEMLDFRNRLYINEGSLAHQYLVEIKKEIEKL